MDVVATTGNLLQRMISGIKLSEEKRVAAANRVEAVRKRETERLRNETNRGMPLSNLDIAVRASHVANNDLTMQAHAGDEQWGQRLTTMYGIAYLAVTVKSIQQQLNSVVQRQDEANTLLLRIAEALEQHNT